MDQVNFSENSTFFFFYINQAYLTIQKGQNIFYGNYWILGQVTEAANPPPDIKGNECETDEVKMYHKIYDIKDGHLKYIVETLGFIVV